MTAAETNRCGKAELDAASKRLDAAYQNAIRQIESRAPGSGNADLAKAKLADSQALWIRFRDTYCDAVYDLWRDGSTPAGIRSSMHSSCMLEHTRQRAAELEWSYGDR